MEIHNKYNNGNMLKVKKCAAESQTNAMIANMM